MLTHICEIQVSWFYSMSTKPMKYFHCFQKVESLWWLISNTKNMAEECVDHLWLPRQGIKGTVDSSWHDSVLLLFSSEGTSQSWRCSGSPMERPRCSSFSRCRWLNLQVQSSLWMAEARAHILTAATWETLSQNYPAKPPWANSATRQQAQRPGPTVLSRTHKNVFISIQVRRKKEILGQKKKKCFDI